MVILLQKEKSKIWNAAYTGDLHIIQELASSGVEVTGIVDVVSMCVAIQYTHSVLFDDIVYSAG